MAKKRIDWEAVAADYITGDSTYRQLSLQYKVSESRCEKKGAMGKWVEKRKQYREGVAAAAISERKKKAALEKADFDVMVERACDITASLVSSELTSRYNDGILTVDTAMEGVQAVKAAQEVKYRALGVPPPKSTMVIDAEEAFKHYQERLAEAMVRLQTEGKLVKASKGNGRPELGPNDFIEIEISDPSASKN